MPEQHTPKQEQPGSFEDSRTPGLDCSDLNFEQVSRIVRWYKDSVDAIHAAHEATTQQAVRETLERLKRNALTVKTIRFPDQYLETWRGRAVTLEQIDEELVNLNAVTKETIMKSKYYLTDDQVTGLIRLIDDEIKQNHTNRDEAYNTYWENIKMGLGYAVTKDSK